MYIVICVLYIPVECLLPALCAKRLSTKTKSVSMYRFPKDLAKRSQWLSALHLTEESIKEHHRVCSRHFPSGDGTQIPSLNLGKRFASPKKIFSPRGVRAANLATKRRRLYCGTKRQVVLVRLTLPVHPMVEHLHRDVVEMIRA